MNKEEILNKYIDLIDKGYCSDCNELNCIDNFPHAKITHAIRNLQQKNQELKKQQKEFISYLEEKEKEFDILGDPKNAGACKGILRKYKSIIGDDK